MTHVPNIFSGKGEKDSIDMIRSQEFLPWMSRDLVQSAGLAEVAH